MYTNDIRLRTRLILEGKSQESHPYKRNRRTSTASSSCSSNDFSLPSPSCQATWLCTTNAPNHPLRISFSSLPSVPHSPTSSSIFGQENVIFERIRKMVPRLHGERNAVQIILDAVSNAMEEPIQLKTPSTPSEEMPADLESVDVTAFKHLIRSQPIAFDPRLLG